MWTSEEEEYHEFVSMRGEAKSGGGRVVCCKERGLLLSVLTVEKM
jgi:hypothetical protein